MSSIVTTPITDFSFDKSNNQVYFNKPKTKTSIYDSLCKKQAAISLIGLGYVGLPIALEFAKSFKVIGFDINHERIQMMDNGEDPSGEVLPSEFKDKSIIFTSNPCHLETAQVKIVAVPTPVNKDNKPDLTPLSKACRTIGKFLRKGDIVIFESTVFPGCTEEVCIPILEEESGLDLNTDFKVGYSPERINPGDKVNTLTKITKVVSGSDAEAEEEIYKIYDHIIEASIHLAPSIKVAEASKIIENTQRDVNIALMNELSLLFNEMGINSHDVLEAAGTKWNFLNFYPGLVGGHCIGVDPYYLIHKAKELKMNLPVISCSRMINDCMPIEVVSRISKSLKAMNKDLKDAKVLVLGATFKEDVTDLRNSKAAEMCQILKPLSDKLEVVDPMSDPFELNKYYQLKQTEIVGQDYDVVIKAVNHKVFDEFNWDYLEKIISDKAVVFDFKRTLGAPSSELGQEIEYLTL